MLAALLTTTLVGSTAAAVATASPAAAGGTETRIVGSDGPAWLTASGYQDQPGPVMYNGNVSLSINVETTSGQQVYDGTLTVQRQLAGQSTWTTVATRDVAYLYETIQAKGNAVYRVLYSGSGSYSASSSDAGLKVQRDLNAEVVSGDRLGIKGKVAPKYAKKKIVVQKKVGKAWKRYSVVRTDGKSRYFARLAAPRRSGSKIFYRLVVPGGGGFAASKSATYYTQRF